MVRRMSATSNVHRRTSTFAAVIVAALSVAFSAAPAQAVTGPPVTPANVKVSYVALGDSYAAGFGGGDYLDDCFTSPNGYAALLAADPGQVHSELRGCTGATTADVLGQLEGLDHRTKSVTLTVGANDLGVAVVAQTCLPPTGSPESVECGQALAYATSPATIVALSTSLNTVLDEIRDAAPRATVYVTGYPLLFEILGPTDPYLTQKAAVNAGIMTLNGSIQAAVDTRDGVVYVDVVEAFAGHGIGSGDPWIIAPTLPPAPPSLEAFHPDPDGYAAYADAIRAAGF